MKNIYLILAILIFASLSCEQAERAYLKGGGFYDKGDFEKWYGVDWSIIASDSPEAVIDEIRRSSTFEGDPQLTRAHGWDPERGNFRNHYVTPLIMAASQNTNPEVIDAILDYGAQVNYYPQGGYPALLFALQENRNPEVAIRLINRGAAFNKNDIAERTIFRHVLDRGDLNILKELVSAGANLNAKSSRDPDGLTVAMRLISKPKLLSFVIENGADIETRDKKGNSILHIAAKSGATETATVLQFYENVNSRNLALETPLMLAASLRKNTQASKSLIDAGATINLIDRNGGTALSKCLHNANNFSIARLLIESGATVQSNDVRTSISKDYSVENIFFLIDSIDPGYQLNWSDDQQLLFDAIKASKPPLIEALVLGGLPIDRSGDNFKGYTPLHAAAKFSDDPEVMTTILRLGGDVNSRVIFETMDPDSAMTPLLLACKYSKSPDCILALINAGADVSATVTHNVSVIGEHARRQTIGGLKRGAVYFAKSNKSIYKSDAYYSLVELINNNPASN